MVTYTEKVWTCGKENIYVSCQYADTHLDKGVYQENKKNVHTN